MSDTATLPLPFAPAITAEHWAGRPSIAVIDLDAHASNLRLVRSLIGPNVKLMAVVKANAYGHGAEILGENAIAAGADELAVATVDEGAQLRAAGIEAPILVLGPIGAGERTRAIGQNMAVVVSDIGFAHALAADAKLMLAKDPVSVHLKIDTGMNRFGTSPELAVATAQAILSHPELRLDGIMTHMAAADDPDPHFERDQIAVFERVLADLADAGIEMPTLHVANSATTLRFPDDHRSRVRVGIAQYGLQPDPAMELPGPFKRIMTIHSRIARIHEIHPGDGVSYGFRYRTDHDELTALVPLGYADGLRRNLSPLMWMAVGGMRAPVAGRICMDQTVVRLPEGVDAKPGDVVTVIGNGSEATAPAPTFDDLAALSETISYELTCGIAPRLPKIYIRGGEVVAISDLAGTRKFT
ncbi:MAG: alanine racemase [Thermomicrobiales bacterium]